MRQYSIMELSRNKRLQGPLTRYSPASWVEDSLLVQHMHLTACVRRVFARVVYKPGPALQATFHDCEML
jgi:hypothetical protein